VSEPSELQEIESKFSDSSSGRSAGRSLSIPFFILQDLHVKSDPIGPVPLQPGAMARFMKSEMTHRMVERSLGKTQNCVWTINNSMTTIVISDENDGHSGKKNENRVQDRH
jgi:hypothetical protein